MNYGFQCREFVLWIRAQLPSVHDLGSLSVSQHSRQNQSSHADVFYRSGSKDGASPGSCVCGLAHDNFVFILLTATDVD